MHWMIDGAYGDLYREAMGHPALKPAVDEWEIERTLNTAPKPRLKERFAAWMTEWRSAIRAAKASALSSDGRAWPVSTESPAMAQDGSVKALLS